MEISNNLTVKFVLFFIQCVCRSHIIWICSLADSISPAVTQLESIGKHVCGCLAADILLETENRQCTPTEMENGKHVVQKRISFCQNAEKIICDRRRRRQVMCVCDPMELTVLGQRRVADSAGISQRQNQQNSVARVCEQTDTFYLLGVLKVSSSSISRGNQAAKNKQTKQKQSPGHIAMHADVIEAIVTHATNKLQGFDWIKKNTVHFP